RLSALVLFDSRNERLRSAGDRRVRGPPDRGAAAALPPPRPGREAAGDRVSVWRRVSKDSRSNRCVMERPAALSEEHLPKLAGTKAEQAADSFRKTGP